MRNNIWTNPDEYSDFKESMIVKTFNNYFIGLCQNDKYCVINKDTNSFILPPKYEYIDCHISSKVIYFKAIEHESNELSSVGSYKLFNSFGKEIKFNIENLKRIDSLEIFTNELILIFYITNDEEGHINYINFKGDLLLDENLINSFDEISNPQYDLDDGTVYVLGYNYPENLNESAESTRIEKITKMFFNSKKK